MKLPGWVTEYIGERCKKNSVYVASWAQGQGVGRGLLDALIARSEAEGIWMLTAGIFPENKASLRLHLGCGFRLVGVRERDRDATCDGDTARVTSGDLDRPIPPLPNSSRI